MNKTVETYADANLMGGVTEYTTPAELMAENAPSAPEIITTTFSISYCESAIQFYFLF